MKRREIERHLRAHGCRQIDEGGKHSRWAGPGGARSVVPRHREVPYVLASRSAASSESRIPAARVEPPPEGPGIVRGVLARQSPLPGLGPVGRGRWRLHGGYASAGRELRPGQRHVLLAGRRLPSYAELIGYFNFQRPIAPGGDLTSNVGESATTPGQLVAVVPLNNGGSSVEFVDATGSAKRAFRCVAAAVN